MGANHVRARVLGRYQRSAARFFFRRPFVIDSPVPVVSFAFDDFPRSALHTGGAILTRAGARGTFYASLGLMGSHAPTGEMFVPEDVTTLLQQGHELGCHTFAHCDSWHTPSDVFEKSLTRNAQALANLVPGGSFRTFSYPINPPRPRSKRNAGKRFVCCRGGGQAFNAGAADLNYLASFFIEKSRDDPQTLRRVIDENRQARGWLILSTHDVDHQPTPFGCTPDTFEEVVESVVRSGARILPVAEACEALCASSHGRARQPGLGRANDVPSTTRI